MDENTLITIRGRGSVPCKIDTIDFILTLTIFGKEGKELTEKEEKMRNDLFSFCCPYDVSSLFDFLSLVKKDDEGEVNVSYNLSSSKEDENKEKALKLAIENAKREADIIAKEMNLTISSVKEIRNEISDIAPYRCASLEAEDGMVSSEVEIVFIAK